MEAEAQKLRHCERRAAVWGWVTIFLFLSGQYNHPWTLAPDYRPELEWGQWTIHAMWWTLLIAGAYWAFLAVCFVQWLSWHDGVIRISGRQPLLERTGSTQRMAFMRSRRRRVTHRVIPTGGMTILAGTPVARPTAGKESQEL